MPEATATSSADVATTRQRKRKRGSAAADAPLSAVPKSTEGLLEMARERSRLARILTSETIRLDRIGKKAQVAAAKQEALYWELKRQILVQETLAAGQPVSEKFLNLANTDCPLLSGALTIEIDQELGERKVVLTVMLNILYIFF